MKKMLKNILVIVLLIFPITLLANHNHHRHNNFGISLFGPGYSISIGNAPFFVYPQPIIVNPVPIIQIIRYTKCTNNFFVDTDQFGNTLSLPYKICWDADQFGNQLSPQYKRW